MTSTLDIHILHADGTYDMGLTANIDTSTRIDLITQSEKLLPGLKVRLMQAIEAKEWEVESDTVIVSDEILRTFVEKEVGPSDGQCGLESS